MKNPNYINWLILGGYNKSANIMLSLIYEQIRNENNLLILENGLSLYDELKKTLEEDDYKIVMLVPGYIKEGDRCDIHQMLNEKGFSTKDLDSKFAIFIEASPLDAISTKNEILNYFCEVADFVTLSDLDSAKNLPDIYFVIDDVSRINLEMLKINYPVLNSKRHFIVNCKSVRHLHDAGLKNEKEIRAVFDRQSFL